MEQVMEKEERQHGNLWQTFVDIEINNTKIKDKEAISNRINIFIIIFLQFVTTKKKKFRKHFRIDNNLPWYSLPYLLVYIEGTGTFTYTFCIFKFPMYRYSCSAKVNHVLYIQHCCICGHIHVMYAIRELHVHVH